jgi:hypothetical protein
MKRERNAKDAKKGGSSQLKGVSFFELDIYRRVYIYMLTRMFELERGCQKHYLQDLFPNFPLYLS